MRARASTYCRLFLIVLVSGVVCAACVLTAQAQTWETATFVAGPAPEAKKAEKPKPPAADVPKELAMRPLPTYRIEPPDILQIEITSKGVKPGEQPPAKQPSGEQPPAKQSIQDEPGANVGTVSGDVQSKIGTGSITGTLAVNKAGGVITLAGAEPASQPGDTGTLTISGSGAANVAGTSTYTGTTVVTGGGTYGTTTVGDGGGTYFFQSSGKPGGSITISGAAPAAEALTLVGTGRGACATHLGIGQYLVAPDGTINLRQYGTVRVTGLTIAEAKAALEKHLASYMESPEVWVDVLGYNSKVYYIITDGAGLGDNVRRIPICGNETVLDAVASVGGISQLSSKRMWLARPSAKNSKNGMVLPIDYEGITRRGATETNYQIMPGDRVFIAGDTMVAVNNKLSKYTAPVERIMGLISLGASTIESVKRLMPQDEEQ